MVISSRNPDADYLSRQLFTAIAPPGTDELNDAEGFFKTYLALPVVIVFWIGGFLWKRTGWLKIEQIDVDTGRRELDWEEINAYKARLAAMPTWRRILHYTF